MNPIKHKNSFFDFNSIARSHLYWGRKHTNSLDKALIDLKPGDIFLDPFCGGGTPAATAIHHGARVLASDINPIAVFITKVLLQPISLSAAHEAFEFIRDKVADNILEYYKIYCPLCKEKNYFDFLQWTNDNDNDEPIAAKLKCKSCNFNKLYLLSKDERKNQFNLSGINPKYWFPSDPIRSHRKAKVSFFYELFTSRNLAALAELFNAIENIQSSLIKNLFMYIFTSMLYSCSKMQMFSKNEPSSSRGWTALRYYLPPTRQEKNVWRAFENRFKTVLSSKKKMNSIIKYVNFTKSMEEFGNSNESSFIYEADYRKFLFPEKTRINYVFLDPPYNDDVDYIGFSEFWSSWLKMKTDIKLAWHPGVLSIEENANNLYQLLLRIKENTNTSSLITLAYGSKRDKAWELIREVINKAGYDFLIKNPIFWDHSQKRRKSKSIIKDQYLLLKRNSKISKLRPLDNLEKEKKNFENELRFFCRVAAFILGNTKAEMIREKASYLIKKHLEKLLSYCSDDEILQWTINRELNRKAYNRLCLNYINFLLKEDEFDIALGNNNRFDETEFYDLNEYNFPQKSQNVPKGVDFIAQNNNEHILYFCFFDKNNLKFHQNISSKIKNVDKNNFKKLCYLIVPSQDILNNCRKVEWASNWQRGFLISFDELFSKVTSKYNNSNSTTISPLSDNYSENVDVFKGEVLENIPVGKNVKTKHYVIRFKTTKSVLISPGQFVMIDTLSVNERKNIDKRLANSSLVSLKERKEFHDIITQRSYLKRPFSIQRAYYENFDSDYLKNLRLPPALATITHTVFPHEFEILYKVIENGTGTNELKEITKGEYIKMLGPLGKKVDLSKLRSEGIEEVHLIGGGVGMAPLIFFGQAFRYYSFKIKAFIGIDNIDTLLIDTLSFAGDPKDAYVYFDNLSKIGLNKEDIFLSCEEIDSSNNLNTEMFNGYFEGFVSMQYESYLKKVEKPEKILVISCGPKRMLKALNKITLNHKIQMKVLLEKRMGCGIGVCMSCVCPTKKESSEEYSRVCIDGPLYDSKDIDWGKL